VKSRRKQTAKAQRSFAIAEAPAGTAGLVLIVAGELDMATVPDLRTRLDKAVAAGVIGIVVDLTRVTFIDSTSLAALLAAQSKLQPMGHLAVVVDTAFVRLVLEASGLDRVLHVFADRRSAEAFAFA
jgi:anti-sigma B factor antagonist